MWFRRPSRRLPNKTLHPSSGIGLGADFVRTLARRGLWWR